MRAVRFDEYGDEDVLTVVEVPDPQPAAGQVIVRVQAAGINPGEAKIRQGALHERWPATFPEGQGSDFAGTIAGVGDDVGGVSLGEPVLGFTNERASQAELVCVPADQIVAKPDALSWEQAGSLFVAGTSAVALVNAVDVGPGDVVVVSAAGGGVGSLAAQWARHAGADLVVGLAGDGNAPWLRDHGIIPVDYHGDDLAARIAAAVDGRRVTALLDTYGAPYPQLAVELGVDPERIATIADFSAGALGAQVVSHSSAATGEVLTELADAIASGDIDLPIAARYPLDQVREAYRELSSGHTHGKIVLVNDSQ